MKKNLKKFFASLLACAMMFSTLTLTAAAEEDEYLMFLAYGGESQDGAWNLCWANEEDNASGIEATTAMAKVGDTVTIGVTLPEAATYTWYMAPVIVAEGVGNVSYTIDKIAIDGNDVTDTVDLTIGENEWWYEGTGNYPDTQAIRLKGGFNEWGDKFFAESPVGFTTIEYTITLTDISFGGDAPAGEDVLSDVAYPAFIAFGGDAEAENDWGFQYYGAGAGSNAGDVVATDGELKNGETTTLSVEFPSEVFYTWFTAPCFVAEDSSLISPNSTFDVKVFLDGEEVTTDLTAGKALWAEGTGDYADTQCLRIGGGYNEWGDKYLAESPKGFKTLTFEITPNIYVLGEAAPVEEEGSAAGPVDLDGVYHAYLGFQTPVFSFRNAFDDATYGRDTDFFNQVTGWDDSNNAVAKAGTFTDVEIAGNGTYTVSVEGLDLAGEFDTQDYLNLLFISTDIPNTNEITISDVELKIDGKNVDLAEGGAIVSPDSKDYLNMLLQNIWNNDVKTLGYYSVPMTKMSITFTVSGFNYDAAVAEAPEAPADGNASAPAEDTTTTAPAEESGSNVGLIVGIVVAVVVVAAVVAGVVVSKKKKASK